MQLRGLDLPEPGSWISLVFVAPPRELAAAARVVWKDERRHAIGVTLERGTHDHDHALAAQMLALAFEAEADLPGALLLADDIGLAAQLCEPLRRHGFLPRAPATELDAIHALERERPRISLALLAGRPFGMDVDDLAAVIAEEYPHVVMLPVEDRLHDAEDLDVVLDDAGYAPRL